MILLVQRSHIRSCINDNYCIKSIAVTKIKTHHSIVNECNLLQNITRLNHTIIGFISSTVALKALWFWNTSLKCGHSLCWISACWAPPPHTVCAAKWLIPIPHSWVVRHRIWDRLPQNCRNVWSLQMYNMKYMYASNYYDSRLTVVTQFLQDTSTWTNWMILIINMLGFHSNIQTVFCGSWQETKIQFHMALICILLVSLPSTARLFAHIKISYYYWLM